VFRPPLSLCIQLKRFTFDSGFGGSGFGFNGSRGFKNGKGKGKSNHRGGAKITKPIEFPAELDLPLSDSRSCAYALTGVVIHVGGSASSGHYTAYFKKPGRKGTNQWYHADDSFVEPVSERTVLRQKDAYVLFYCRKEVKLEFPSPPPRAMSAEAALEFARARARARADSLTQDESRKKLLRDDADEAETEEISANSNTSPSAKLALEPVPTKDGAVKRVKTKIHPLASLPPATSQPLKEAGIDTLTSASSAIRWTIKTRPASFPDESMRTSQVLGKDLLKRLSEVSRATSKPDKLLYNIQSAKGENKDVDSSSSSSDESPADDEGAAEPTKTSHNNDDSSSASSSSDSVLLTEVIDTEDAPAKKEAKPKKTSDADTSNDSSQSEEEKVKGKARVASKVPENHVKLITDAKDSKDTESSSDSDATSSSDDDSQGSSSKQVQKSFKTKSSTGGLDAPLAKAALKDDSKESHRTRVVLSRADSRGKVKVMLGPRKKRSWKTRVPTSGVKGAAFELLGNTGVSTWDDEDDQGGDSKRKASNGCRSNIVGKMDKQERSRKRKMHLDRWDALLDQGKVREPARVAFYLFGDARRLSHPICNHCDQTKKMKQNSESNDDSFVSQVPKKNVFQRIQSGIQSMNRGKAKGLFRQKDKGSKAGSKASKSSFSKFSF
jgi:ubiquitin carboxyl-terminal hydrolase 36/42